MRLAGLAEEAEGGSILAGWPEKDWARLLLHAELCHYRAGETVLCAGESDRTIYIVIDGTLGVHVPSGERVDTVARGAVLGEVAFFDAEPRSASVIADGDAALLRLTTAGYDALWSRDPLVARALVFELGRVLAARFREERRNPRASRSPVQVAATLPLPSTRVEVDEELREKQVAEIASSEFFRRLQERATSLRKQARTPNQGL